MGSGVKVPLIVRRISDQDHEVPERSQRMIEGSDINCFEEFLTKQAELMQFRFQVGYDSLPVFSKSIPYAEENRSLSRTFASSNNLGITSHGSQELRCLDEISFESTELIFRSRGP